MGLLEGVELGRPGHVPVATPTQVRHAVAALALLRRLAQGQEGRVTPVAGLRVGRPDRPRLAVRHPRRPRASRNGRLLPDGQVAKRPVTPVEKHIDKAFGRRPVAVKAPRRP